MEIFKVHIATDNKIVLENDKQLESLFKEITNDQNFMVQWTENNERKTKLFLADGLLARLKDGRLMLEAKKDLEKDDEDYDEDAEDEEEDN